MSESMTMSMASAACLTQLSSCASLEALCMVDSIFLASSIRSFNLSRIEKSVGNEGRSMSMEKRANALARLPWRRMRGWSYLCPVKPSRVSASVSLRVRLTELPIPLDPLLRFFQIDGRRHLQILVVDNARHAKQTGYLVL